MIRRVALAFAAAAALAGCGGEEFGDLKQELGQLTKDLRGRVEPLPQVKPYEPVPYKAEGEVDPFQRGRIDVANVAGAGTGGGKRPDPNRPREPLEAFPLESIQMVGTLQLGKDTFGIVRAGPNLFRVKRGNYLGQNFGVITTVEEGQILLRETVQDGSGDWVERQSALQLQEIKR